jgi:Domain of unknown function (DUF4124)
MKLLTAILVAFAASACFGAETYKWVDDKGVTTYGEKPPAGRPAKPVDTTPVGPVGSIEQRSAPDKAATGKRPAGDEQASRSVPVPASPSQASVRGMDFQTFVRLERGMTEGEVLVRAGQPDHESVENFRHDIVKTWYYFPTTADPFTTVLTMRGGRIANLDRVKKF